MVSFGKLAKENRLADAFLTFNEQHVDLAFKYFIDGIEEIISADFPIRFCGKTSRKTSYVDDFNLRHR